MLDVILLLLANKHFFQDCIQYTTPHLSFKQYVTKFANIYVTVLQRIICLYFGQISSQTFNYISWKFSRTFSWTLQQNRHVIYIHPAWRFSSSLSKQTFFFQDCIQYTTPHLSFKQYVTNFANIHVTVLQRIICLYFGQISSQTLANFIKPSYYFSLTFRKHFSVFCIKTPM
jgi:hypothetical protein